jgi:hypothetical protein
MKALIALYLDGNQIEDVGTQHLAHTLQTNQVMKIHISNPFFILSHVDISHTLLGRKSDWNTRCSTSG